MESLNNGVQFELKRTFAMRNPDDDGEKKREEQATWPTREEIARKAARKQMDELEQAGYLDFDGGEQEERSEWLERFTKSHLRAIMEATSYPCQ